MEINLKNIEEIIFFDNKVQSLFPEFRFIFDQWKLGLRVSGLKQLSQQSVLELMDNLGEKELEKLSNYLGKTVSIGKLNAKVVDHYDCNIIEHDRLCEFSDYTEFSVYRKGDDLKLTFWR